MHPTKVLFVCLGNICRSPAAEGIMKTIVARERLEDLIFCDSAGTSAYHEGDLPDARMRAHAKERGYDLTSRSRPFLAPDDFFRFNYILTMDESNFRNVSRLDKNGEFAAKILPIVKFCTLHAVAAVPDPYYEGDEGFRLVLDILEDACANFLEHLRREMGPK